MRVGFDVTLTTYKSLGVLAARCQRHALLESIQRANQLGHQLIAELVRRALNRHTHREGHARVH